MELIDAGVYNRLPVEAAFDPPFAPEQVLAVDISKHPQHRKENLERCRQLRTSYPDIPIDCVCVDETLDGRSVFYRHSYAARLLDSGRAAAKNYLASRDAYATV